MITLEFHSLRQQLNKTNGSACIFSKKDEKKNSTVHMTKSYLIPSISEIPNLWAESIKDTTVSNKRVMNVQPIGMMEKIMQILAEKKRNPVRFQTNQLNRFNHEWSYYER